MILSATHAVLAARKFGGLFCGFCYNLAGGLGKFFVTQSKLL